MLHSTLTPEKNSLDNYSTFKMPLKVQLIDDIVLYGYGKGNVHLTVLNGSDKTNVVLNDVLFFWKIQNKIFSLPSNTKKKGCKEKHMNHH